jgi:hypothetical protein
MPKAIAVNGADLGGIAERASGRLGERVDLTVVARHGDDLGDTLAEREQLLRLAETQQHGRPIEVARGRAEGARHPEAAARQIAAGVLHRDCDLVADLDLETLGQLLADHCAQPRIAEPLALDERGAQQRDARLALGIDADHPHSRALARRAHEPIAAHPRGRGAQARARRQRALGGAAFVVEHALELGVVVPAGCVDLDVAELGLDGRLDHLVDHSVVDGHRKQRAADADRHGKHDDPGPPRAAPQVAPSESPQHGGTYTLRRASTGLARLAFTAG